MSRSAALAGAIQPSRIGRYRLVDRIGGGATSTVYSAVDDQSGRRVAVKTIADDHEEEPDTRERFLREAQITAELQHPQIVAVLDAGDDQGRPFLVMELLNGLPLRDHLATNAVGSLDAKLDLMIQLCRGLQAAHDRGVVHRDVKPGNLFITRDGGLKILDFGLARLKASTLTANGQILGTPDFMSPEQAEGRRVDARSDVFSAAAVSYFILTGRAPFTGRDLRETLSALIDGAPAPIADPAVPRALKRALFKGLAKAPEQRFARCADMQASLERVRRSLGRSPLVNLLAALVGSVRS